MPTQQIGKVSITPKGQWHFNRGYEKLDMVTDLDGKQTYIAKKDVPATTALDSSEYWQRIAYSVSFSELPTFAYASSSTDIIPSTGWSETPPDAGPGNYLWSRTVQQCYPSGAGQLVTVAVAKNGLDGTGSVNSVNGKAGNVVLTPEDIGLWYYEDDNTFTNTRCPAFGFIGDRDASLNKNTTMKLTIFLPGLVKQGCRLQLTSLIFTNLSTVSGMLRESDNGDVYNKVDGYTSLGVHTNAVDLVINKSNGFITYNGSTASPGLPVAGYVTIKGKILAAL